MPGPSDDGVGNETVERFHSMDEIGFGGMDLETKNVLFALFIGGVFTGGSTFFFFILGGSKRSFAKTGSGQATKKEAFLQLSRKRRFVFRDITDRGSALPTFDSPMPGPSDDGVGNETVEEGTRGAGGNAPAAGETAGAGGAGGASPDGAEEDAEAYHSPTPDDNAGAAAAAAAAGGAPPSPLQQQPTVTSPGRPVREHITPTPLDRNEHFTKAGLGQT